MEDIQLRGKLGRHKPSSQLEELGQEAVSNRLSTENLSVGGVKRCVMCVCAYCYLFSVN